MPSRRTTTLTLISILLLATVLRLYRIDAQSFWSDEGNSARIAERNVALILEGAAGDIHPPLYYLVLHAWRSLVGGSEADLRALSALFGVITVGAVFLLGRRLFEARVGLLAAFLVAVNPFQVYYSQEARMYMMLAALGGMATYLLVRLLDFWSLRPRIHIPHRRYYLLYIITLAAGLYTHYAFPFIFVVHFAIVLAWSFYRPGRALAHIASWLPLALSAVVLFLPWLPIALRQILSWPSLGASPEAGVAAGDLFRFYVLGPTVPAGEANIALIVAGFFLLMSAWSPDAFDEPEPDWDTAIPRVLRFGTIALYWLLPIALIFSLGLFKDAYLKFLLVGSPAFCLLLARGIDNGWQIARGALSMPRELTGPREIAFSWIAVVLFLVALILVPALAALNHLYHDPVYARDDYRGIARTIEAGWRAGDAVLLHAANQWEVFTYYHPDSPHVFPIVKQRPLDPTATEHELQDILAAHRRLFVLYWATHEPDPERFVEAWLDRHTYKANETWYGNVRLALYAVPVTVADDPETRVEFRLGDRIWLDGYSLLTPVVAPGDTVQLVLFWRCEDRVDQRYKVFVHILDPDGAIVAQTDREPGSDLYLTTNWTPGEKIIDRYGVAVPGATPAGDYRIQVGMYTLEGQRLRIYDGDADIGDTVTLAQVAVAP
ncbi:MAG TPA: glycosyltransferase family 39 protein [Anaerolineae bacterium]|nr:glycosyltransferase family 39 protein [Anaerolineae bacterium]